MLEMFLPLLNQIKFVYADSHLCFNRIFLAKIMYNFYF